MNSLRCIAAASTYKRVLFLQDFVMMWLLIPRLHASYAVPVRQYTAL